MKKWLPCGCALLLAASLAGFVCGAHAAEDAEPEGGGDEAAETPRAPTDDPATPPRAVEAPPDFRPSEEVPFDMGIDFPVDI